jgi:glycosyltransferase involved in cell wall biosynthesis
MKICIISEYAYSLGTNKSGTPGGAELQTTLLAKEFVKRSYDVSFVVFVKKEYTVKIIDGIKVYNPFDNQLSGHTYLYPQNMYKLFKLLKKIDADIYIQMGETPLTGAIAFFSKLKNKVFLYLAASDRDVTVTLLIKSIKDLKKLFFRFGVKHCDCVICQTSHQKNLLKQTINKEGKIIKSLYPSTKIKHDENGNSKLKILWVGRLIKEKRPELFLKLAKTLPEFRFWMIGPKASITDAAYNYYCRIKEEASRIKNLDFIGFVPHNKIDKYYAKSSLLINTSPSEGFPNTFLEAWGNYVPVVTLGFDPDGIISRYRLGFNSKTFDQMVEDIKTLLKNEKLRKEMGMNSWRYVRKEHDIKKILKEYEKIIDQLKVGG